MRRHGLDDIPDAPLPDGLEIRPVAEDQWRTILDAENEAFRDHWGHREMTESDFTTTFDRAELDTDLWVVAWDGDQVAGVVQNWIWPEENERLGVKRGWLEHISVRRPWRRRGLARAITAASLVKFREVGLDGGDARRRFGEPERRARAVRGPRLRGPGEPRGGVPARPDALTGGSGEQAPAVADELHPGSLAADRRGRAVAGQDADVVLELGQPRERRDHRVGVAAGQVDAAPAAGEERVAAEQEALVLGDEADRALGVAGRVEDAQADLAERDDAALGQLDGRDRRRDLERRVERLRVRQPLAVERMDGDLRARCGRRPRRCRRCGPSGRGSRR